MVVEMATSPVKVIGLKGLKNLGGRIQEEWLAALKSWSKEFKVYQEMRSDPVIGTLLDALKLPLLAAEFDVQPMGDEETDDRARTFLWDNLNGMERQAWRNYVTTALEVLDFGFAISEIILEKRTDGKLWLKSLEPRAQESLEQWEFDETDTATAMIQRDPDTGKLLTIPLEKCVHVAFRGRKGNPQGQSLLRNVYKPWRFMTNLKELEAIGVERDIGGMPIAQLPEESLTGAQETDLKNALKGLRQDEELYLIVPHGMEVKPYGGGNKMYDVGAIIERYKAEILMFRFAQFLKLGMEKVGTQALVKGSQDFFTLGLISIQQELLEVWNGQLVPYLFRHNNFPGLKKLPQITWADPGKVDITALLGAYGQGVQSGVLTVIREDEEHLRVAMGLPELPEGEGEGIRSPIEQQPLVGLFGRGK